MKEIVVLCAEKQVTTCVSDLLHYNILSNMQNSSFCHSQILITEAFSFIYYLTIMKRLSRNWFTSLFTYCTSCVTITNTLWSTMPRVLKLFMKLFMYWINVLNMVEIVKQHMHGRSPLCTFCGLSNILSAL